MFADNTYVVMVKRIGDDHAARMFGPFATEEVAAAEADEWNRAEANRWINRTDEHRVWIATVGVVHTGVWSLRSFDPATPDAEQVR